MRDEAMLQAGDGVTKTITFTLPAGDDAARVTLLLTRTDAHSEHPATGRARCIVLEAHLASAGSSNTPPGIGAEPRGRFEATLHGVVPASICGGSYVPVFCIFAYHDGRPSTGFEIDADQRFAVGVADDAAAVDGGPSISSFSST